MTHHTLIAMFGTGAARSHLHVDLITSVKSRERLKHPCTQRGINENIISVCFRVYFWGDDHSVFVLVVTKTFKIIFLKCLCHYFFKQVVVA